jgi:myo-inositol-1(or 4)-monophosphatase
LAGGATLNGRAISASSAVGLDEGLTSIGYSSRVSPEETLRPLTRLMNRRGMFHRSGSGALSLAYVAAGRLLGYFEPHMNSWDYAASVLIIKEAGGVINDCLPNDEALIKGSLVLAAAPGIYDALNDVAFGSD